MTAFKIKRFSPLAAAVLLCAVATGCGTAGLYGNNSRRLDTATRAFASGNFPEAKAQFAALADQTESPDASAAGRYGLICLAMAAAEDIPSFQKALEILSRFPDARRFQQQNPVLLLAGVQNGVRLMEKRLTEQNSTIRRLSEEKDKAGMQNGILEQTLKDLKFQLKEIESIDRDLQEKRNPS